MTSHVIGTYKEIQIHGPVQFAKDIERVYISKDELKLGDAKTLLQQVKTFCSKHKIDYELFENDPLPGYPGFIDGGLGLGIAQKPAEQRIIGDKKELTLEDLKKPEPVGFGLAGHGGGFAGFGAASGFSFAAPAPMFSPSLIGGVWAPRTFSVPKTPPKKKQYGVDYI